MQLGGSLLEGGSQRADHRRELRARPQRRAALAAGRHPLKGCAHPLPSTIAAWPCPLIFSSLWQVVATILASTTRLVANRAAWADPAKRTKIEDVALLLQGALVGRKMVGLKMNLQRASLEEVRQGSPLGCMYEWVGGWLAGAHRAHLRRAGETRLGKDGRMAGPGDGIACTGCGRAGRLLVNGAMAAATVYWRVQTVRLLGCSHSTPPAQSSKPASLLHHPPPPPAARPQVCGALPAERSPTISQQVDPDYVAVEVILEERQAREAIPLCKRLGATGIITYPVDVVIH